MSEIKQQTTSRKVFSMCGSCTAMDFAITVDPFESDAHKCGRGRCDNQVHNVITVRIDGHVIKMGTCGHIYCEAVVRTKALKYAGFTFLVADEYGLYYANPYGVETAPYGVPSIVAQTRIQGNWVEVASKGNRKLLFQLMPRGEQPSRKNMGVKFLI